ncbi:RING-H2 finger protein ATL16-like [Andrographis paniculata]|uniref:RING-H2 finger protein ATL16-like n=1 Tax=Andrographis paniculata TaxID=175694 RepID=UPI0021E74359|nr:RING-H2 finger protein ATL16-like [Andrographis paniculata]
MSSPSPTLRSPNSNLSKWDPKVIAIAGLLCIIVLIFSYYKIIGGRGCATFRIIRLSRNSNHRRRLNAHLEDFSSTFHSRGLDSFVMRSLPITQVCKEKGEEFSECAVCLGQFEDEDWIKHLPACSHVFHVSCIDTWFQTHASCPLCRSHVGDVASVLV